MAISASLLTPARTRSPIKTFRFEWALNST
jgi:hypothetical protein